MIRALRIALANWIMPKPTSDEMWKELANAWYPPGWLLDDAKVVAAVKTFPGGLTVWPKP